MVFVSGHFSDLMFSIETRFGSHLQSFFYVPVAPRRGAGESNHATDTNKCNFRVYKSNQVFDSSK